MRYWLSAFIVCSFLASPKTMAQTFGFQLRAGFQRVEIPFEMHNNLIVVDLVLGKKIPVKFIFDTGAEHTIICKKEIVSLLGLQYDRTFKMLGADFKKILTAYLVKSVAINLVNDAAQAKQDVLVLEEDYYRFDECTGQPIHGILGADLFNRFVVQIDYVRKKIYFADAGKFTEPNKFTTFPIEIIKGKPYFYPRLALRQAEFFPVKLLLDTGAGLSLLLFNNTHPLLAPPPNSIKGSLAIGLGGSVDGFMGKINTLQLSENIAFSNLITDFQDVGDFVDTTYAASRNGIVGQKILIRFDVIIDYVRGKLYLKPNKNYKKPLEEDHSGLMILASGEKLNNYHVNDIIPGSPAHWADIRVGDEIIKINKIPTPFYNIDDVYKIFRKKVGTTMHITIVRHGKKYKKQFILKDLFLKNESN